MNKLYNAILLSMLSAVTPLIASAQDDSQAELRENPDMETPTSPAVAYSDYPSYIRLAANRVDLNGADWSGLSSLFSAAADTLVTVVHIGDSHLQADMATAVTRDRLQQIYGDAGRGLIVPFKLAGTNEPVDYAITSPDGWVASRLLKMPWPTDMSFTGVAVQSVSPTASLTVRTGSFFDDMTVFATSPGLEINSVSDGNGDEINFDVKSDGRRTRIALSRPCTEIRMSVSRPHDVAIGGISLSNGHNGVAYHVIGNNGATYSTYNLIGSVGRDLSELSPQLIIVSLGTNEAFGKMTDAAFRLNINDLVGELRRNNPDACLLLVTPAECQRRTSRRVRRKGKRRRYRTVSSYSVNTNVKRMRDVIVAYGRDNGIPVYDWYEVAGGTGASARWLADKTLNKDRVHLTYKGYQLQGNLFTDALLDAINQHSLQIK
ncbi:MAG: GDSL-type esterase/lipase family protein [Bacteroidales bacterium]|nr:GDSL-type esterase/lipase family protein [Bacteroidales bacterium]